MYCTAAGQCVAFSFSTLHFFRSMLCASVCCAVPNVVLHKIMIMPECVGDGSTCQYIWHFEESGFDVIRSKMFETHNRSGMCFLWASSWHEQYSDLLRLLIKPKLPDCSLVLRKSNACRFWTIKSFLHSQWYTVHSTHYYIIITATIFIGKLRSGI